MDKIFIKGVTIKNKTYDLVEMFSRVVLTRPPTKDDPKQCSDCGQPVTIIIRELSINPDYKSAYNEDLEWGHCGGCCVE